MWKTAMVIGNISYHAMELFAVMLVVQLLLQVAHVLVHSKDALKYVGLE